MWLLILVAMLALCAVAYLNRVTLLAKALGHSESHVDRQLRRHRR